LVLPLELRSALLSELLWVLLLERLSAKEEELA
jgi:hypothetical protein